MRARWLFGAALAMVAIGALAAVGAGVADPARAAGDRPGRFTMSPAEGGGFVRLDTETGRMALCERQDGAWTCREMAGAGTGTEQEVARLRAENDRLRGELREMEDTLLGDRRSAAGRGPSGTGVELRLPTERDIDGVFDYAQRMLRKLRERWKELEAESKGTPL